MTSEGLLSYHIMAFHGVQEGDIRPQGWRRYGGIPFGAVVQG